jgi:hypothetical protein
LFDWSFLNTDLSIEAWKLRTYEEIVDYHKPVSPTLIAPAAVTPLSFLSDDQ